MLLASGAWAVLGFAPLRCACRAPDAFGARFCGRRGSSSFPGTGRAPFQPQTRASAASDGSGDSAAGAEPDGSHNPVRAL